MPGNSRSIIGFRACKGSFSFTITCRPAVMRAGLFLLSAGSPEIRSSSDYEGDPECQKFLTPEEHDRRSPCLTFKVLPKGRK